MGMRKFWSAALPFGKVACVVKGTTTNNNMDIDTMQTGAINIQFGIGLTALIRSVAVKTPIGLVNFHVVKADTPFLLCLADMDRL